MDEICEFIQRYAPVANENIGLSVIQDINKDDYLEDIIKYLYEELHKYLGDEIDDVVFYYDNLCVQNETIISFKYKNVPCNVSEYFNDRFDYWRVSVIPSS